MKLVKPQHFLPVHGEYAFLCAHAQLARDIGITNTSVIRNGAFLGVSPKRNGKTVSTGSMQVLGDAKLRLFYNDGNKVRSLQAVCPLLVATLAPYTSPLSASELCLIEEDLHDCMYGSEVCQPQRCTCRWLTLWFAFIVSCCPANMWRTRHRSCSRPPKT